MWKKKEEKEEKKKPAQNQTEVPPDGDDLTIRHQECILNNIAYFRRPTIIFKVV